MPYQIDAIIENAIAEDIGDGDHTSLACISESETGKAHLLVKQQGIIAGVEVAERIFRHIDYNLKYTKFIDDGTNVKPGDIVFHIEGKVRHILQAERLVLNVMQRMSGIATVTRKYVDRLEGLHTNVLDTRKTTPGMRILEKQAVKIGGGENHRMGLFGMILIKDNHIDFAGGIEKAIIKSKEYLAARRLDIKIEIEVRNMEELKKVLEVGKIDRIMLDNFSTELTKEAVKLIDGSYETESSGGITIENLRDYAECGVDYISVGALTHQIKSLDLSLKAID